MMPDILKQVGPKQYQFLKSQMGNIDTKAAAVKDDSDDVPELVGTFEDAGKKGKKWETLAENTVSRPYESRAWLKALKWAKVC